MAGTHLLVMSPSGLRNPAMVQGYWRLVAHYGATLAGAVPTGLGAVLDVPPAAADLNAVRAGFCGAASLPPAVGERFRQVTGRKLYEVYGMTEASGLVAIDPVAGSGGVGSVGWALPYTQVQVRLLHADGGLGSACEPGEIGVITAHGPHVSPGYRNPAHDAGVFDEGMLNTGDLGYTDEEGRRLVVAHDPHQARQQTQARRERTLRWPCVVSRCLLALMLHRAMRLNDYLRTPMS